MKCPKCGDGRCTYIEPRKRSEAGNKEPVPRKNFKAKCRKCKWEGEI